MNKKNIIRVALLAMGLPLLTACNDFLDELPDNRTEVDSESKVISMLVEAYPDNGYPLVNELMSDNVETYLRNNPYTERFIDQVYNWEDVTESNNESPESFYQSCYQAIANANLALEGIMKLDNWQESENMRNAYAEALMCRAYGHFILVNEFCMAYDPKTAASYMGMPYITEAGTSLNPQYGRGTLEEAYNNIKADIEEALPYVGDSHLSVPKYHFNSLAAYAFATRFYLYHQEWDKAIEYANKCLGKNPKSMLRDNSATASMTQSFSVISQHYIDTELNCNLLLLTSYSNMGVIFGPYSYNKKYQHTNYISTHETTEAENIWGSGRKNYYDKPKYYSGTNYNYVIFWHSPFLFEYTDPVAGIGYRHSVYPAFTTDECLLNRAEAYVMTGQYDKAAADLTSWMQNTVNTSLTLTPDTITNFYNSVKYSYDEDGETPTIKKHLHPGFSIGAEGSTQECMLQCVLGFRRIETLQMGIRWWDVKRYGIIIPRRTISISLLIESVDDWLTEDDPRRAIQIPLKVRDAGLDPNPRNDDEE